MPRPERIARIADSWHADALVAAAYSILVLSYEVAVVPVHGSRTVLETCLGIAFSSSIVARRAHPKLAAAAAACCAALMSLGSYPNDVSGDALLVPLLLAYSLGTDPDWAGRP